MVRQLDWEEAAKICEEYNGCRIFAGLLEDWDYTSGEIFDGDKRVENKCVFVSSYWATPGVMVDEGDGFCEFTPCFKDGEDSNMPDWWTEGAE